jgi:hypothetical protein
MRHSPSLVSGCLPLSFFCTDIVSQFDRLYILYSPKASNISEAAGPNYEKISLGSIQLSLLCHAGLPGRDLVRPRRALLLLHRAHRARGQVDPRDLSRVEEQVSNYLEGEGDEF